MYYPLIKNKDTFEAEITGTKCKGKVSIDKNGAVFLCQNEIDETNLCFSKYLCFNKLGYKYAVTIGFQDNIKAMENDVKNLKILSREDGSPVANVGDIIVDKDGDKAEVLAVNGDCFLRSCWNDFDDTTDCWYKNSEIKKNGLKIEGIEEDKAEEYIKYLEKVGRIKKGKIIN